VLILTSCDNACAPYAGANSTSLQAMKKHTYTHSHPAPKRKAVAVAQKPPAESTSPKKIVHRAAPAAPAAKAPLSNTPPPQNKEDMEVHHHRAPAKGSWKKYVFEFFMLFLAVFCGFMAEWQLEHAIERQREKQFIRSLAEDLKRDTAEAAAYIRFNETTLRYCDSLQDCLLRPDLPQQSNAFYNYSRELARLARYNPTDRTLQQLKNAGNMRLIRKWDVSNAITEYDSKTRLLTELDGQLNAQKTKYRDRLIEFLDLSSYDRTNKPDSYMDPYIQTAGNPGFINMDGTRARLLYNQAFTLRIFSDILIRSAADVKTNATNLLETLRKEYGIE
jgi:hypothetical protein